MKKAIKATVALLVIILGVIVSPALAKIETETTKRSFQEIDTPTTIKKHNDCRIGSNFSCAECFEHQTGKYSGFR